MIDLNDYIPALKTVSDAASGGEHEAPVTDIIAMIIEQNRQRGRLRWYLDQNPMHIEQSYRALVAQEYEAQHRFIEALQVRKEPAEWQKLHERLQVMAQRLFGRWGFSSGLSQQMAADAAQDACLEILYAHYPYDFKFMAWVSVMLHHVCYKYAQQARADEKVQVDLEVTELDPKAAVAANQDIELELTAATQRASTAVAQLSRIQQEVIIEHYIQGKSLAEVAAVAEVPINTIYKRHYDALYKLRKILGGSEH